MPTRFLYSLRARLLFLFAALAVGPLLTVGVFDYVRSRRTVDNLITTQTDSIAHRAAATIRDRYAVITSDILLLTENADVQHYAHAVIAGDSAASASARDVAAAFVRTAWKMDSVSYYAVELRDLDGAPIVRLTNDLDSGYVRHRATIVSTVRDIPTGRTAATLILTPRLDPLLSRETLGPPFGRTGETIILDRHADAILQHPNQTLLSKAPRELFGNAWPAIEPMLANPSGTVEYTDRDSLRVGSFVSLSTPAWTVLSSTAVSEFADTFARTRVIDMTFLLALGCAVAIAFVILVGRATRSLEELTHAAAAIGGGDLSPALPRPTRDEVGTLSRAFAEMTCRVRSMMREIAVSRQLAVLGEFAAQLSHEVRNPLTSLKLDLQGMQRQIRSGALPPTASPAVESALREINRLDTVVRGVLELGRESRRANTRCSAHDAVETAIGAVRSQLAARGVCVEVCLSASNATVDGDPDLLAGMFMNLLLNASEAQPSGGRVGVLSANRDAVGERWIDISIADDGPGIPAERRDEVFRPFYTSRHDGTGLGLPLALRTARDHNGHLAIVDPPAGYRGAAITVSLPLAPA